MGPKSIMFFSVLSENLDCVATYDALLGMCAETLPESGEAMSVIFLAS